MSAGHKHHKPETPIDQFRVQELHLLMAQQWFQEAAKGYGLVDADHDVPYVAGSKIDGHTICFDVHFMRAVRAGQFKIAGKPHNPLHTTSLHEVVEGVILRHWELVRALLQWKESGRRYTEAHDIADVAERLGVQEQGVDWAQYQKAFEPFVRIEEHEQITDPPQGLLLDPYQGDNKLMTILMKAGGKTSEQLGFDWAQYQKAFGDK